ncbi:MAG TPA: hypothetical protein PKD03_12140 [Ignavibacteriaceae bacterium]|nr:hypothetical protein [Ignavibacteriaceae bacterium]
MNNINDEMLNKYIDKELNAEQIRIIDEAIKNSPELKSRYLALVNADSVLRKMNFESVTPDFTRSVLQRIQRRKLLAKQQKHFLFAVISLLGIITLGIVVYLFYQIISLASPESDKIVTTYSKDLGDYFSNLFGKKNISIFGSVLSFIMLVSSYFLYEYQKKSKNNFNH